MTSKELRDGLIEMQKTFRRSNDLNVRLVRFYRDFVEHLAPFMAVDKNLLDFVTTSVEEFLSLLKERSN